MAQAETPHCSICQLPIPARGTWTKGNSAWPVNDGRCCYDCDDNIVIPARINLIKRDEKILAAQKEGTGAKSG